MKLNKTMSKVLVFGLIISSVGVVGNTNVASAASKYIGEKKAKSIMLKKVPGAKFTEFKLDKDSTPEYEAELVKGSYEYEISVNAKTGKITEYEKEKTKMPSGKLIGEKKAKQIMLKKVPGANIVEFELDKDSTPEYEAELVKGSYEYEISVNAKTGKITEFEKEKVSKKNYIGEKKAKSIALKKVSGAKVVKFKLDDGEYEIELRKGSYKYELEIDAKTGKITEYEKEKIKTSSSKYIGEKKAKEIMLKKVPGAKFIKFKLDDGEYEAELVKGNYEYEITVDAKTGKITDYEKDRK
ncbi:MAG: PepSY domain-containing protein [Peptostreptococcaceae bacterium]